MPTPAAQIITSGTPVTNQLGVGAIAGNAVTIGGLSLAPNQPGFTLVSSKGGPGFVAGTWQLGPTLTGGDLPAQGAFYRSGSGGSGGGGGNEETDFSTMESSRNGAAMTKTGWIVIGLIAAFLLTEKD